MRTSLVQQSPAIREKYREISRKEPGYLNVIDDNRGTVAFQ